MGVACFQSELAACAMSENHSVGDGCLRGGLIDDVSHPLTVFDSWLKAHRDR